VCVDAACGLHSERLSLACTLHVEQQLSAESVAPQRRARLACSAEVMAQLSGAPGNVGQVEPVPPLQAPNEATPRLDSGLPESSSTPPGPPGLIASEDKEPQKSWTTTAAPFKTLPHAFVAFLGLGGAACFSVAVVFKHPFDACVAVGLVLLCGYVFALQTERCRLECARQEQPKLSEVLATDGPAAADAAARARAGPAASGTSELDLTGYAKTLGVSMRSGGPMEGSTLNKILMNALAKEYLRCVSALRCYQSAFGPLEDAATARASTSGLLDASSSFLDVQAARPCMSRPDALNLPLDTVETGVEQTPRSPRGPPSPEEKRRRAYISGFQEGGQMQDTPDFQRGSPEEREQCSVRSIGTALQNAASTFSAGACSSADASPGLEAGTDGHYAASAESTVTPSFSASPERPAAVSGTPPAPRTTTRYYDTPTSAAGPAEPGLEAAAKQAEQPPASSFGLFR